MDWVECMVDVDVWRGIKGRGAERGALDPVRLARGARAAV